MVLVGYAETVTDAPSFEVGMEHFFCLIDNRYALRALRHFPASRANNGERMWIKSLEMSEGASNTNRQSQSCIERCIDSHAVYGYNCTSGMYYFEVRGDSGRSVAV